eukprot:sb/3466255/
MDNNATVPTEFQLTQPVERTLQHYLLIGWNIFAAIVSLSGNITVLSAAIRYSAFKLDKVTVLLICNIAIADLGFTITCIVPSIFTIYWEAPVIGRSLCIVFNILDEIFLAVDIFFVCALNISKLLSLISPLRSRYRRRSSGVVAATMIWIFGAFLVQGLPNLLCNPIFAFDRVTYQCSIHIIETCPWVNIYYGALVLFGPFLVVLVTTIWLILHVVTVTSSRLQKQGILTLILVSVSFFIANIPFCGLFALVTINHNFIVTSLSWFPDLNRAVIYILNINIIANPCIYYLSIASFKEFVQGSICNQRDIMVERFRSYNNNTVTRGEEEMAPIRERTQIIPRSHVRETV